ncbi:MAG: carbohydrate-binding domain-containing protein [Clostridia bacterium]|nr:carbohydrate-binding domain-containing protein [Clostridia bacterium]
MKRFILIIIISILALSLSACGDGGSDTGTLYTPDGIDAIDTSGMDFTFTERDISAEMSASVVNISFRENGVSADNSVEIYSDGIKITNEGTYILSGTGNNMLITVDAPESKVQLVLDNLTLNNTQGPVIYIKSGKKVFITLADGSENTLSDGTGYDYTDDGSVLDGAIFSKADLTINGKGKLTVKGNYKHGIVSKDDLIIVNAALDISALSCAVNGKDCVKIKDAALTLSAGTDGIRSDNEEDVSRGFVYIEGGDFLISSGSDGIQAHTLLKIADGDFKITSGQADLSDSGKCLKSNTDINILGGVYEISGKDDGVHANGSIAISKGDFTIRTNDDGIHADKDLEISGGKINIVYSYEGLEAQRILINGGNISILATDDGMNAAGGNDSSGMGGPFGGDRFGSDSNAEIVISDGYIVVDAYGDGIDSNGSIVINGGITLVSGPTNGGNGSLDYARSASVYGGTFIATGANGMAQGMSDATNQGAIFTATGTQNEGTSIGIYDKSGNILASFTPKKAYQCAVITAPNINKGETYYIVCGATVSDADGNGYASNTTFTGGTRVATIDMDSLLYGSAGGMGGMGGGPGGMHGGGMGGKPPR